MITLKVSFLLPEDDGSDVVAFYLDSGSRGFSRIEMKREASIRSLIDTLKAWTSKE